MNKPFQTLTQNIVWQCPWYAVRQDEIRLPDGSHGVYNTIMKGPAVWVVPVTPSGDIVLIHHYRYTVDDWCYELPAGGVKPGQRLEEAAREELREEVGGVAGHLAYLGQFYTANGICDEVGHFFLATDVIVGEPTPEPVEVMTIHRKPITEALDMARHGQITDAPSLMVLLLCEPHLRQLIP